MFDRKTSPPVTDPISSIVNRVTTEIHAIKICVVAIATGLLALAAAVAYLAWTVAHG